VGRIEDLERQFSKAPLSDDSVAQLRDLSERLSQVISRHARVDPARTPRRRVTDKPVKDWPRQDPLLDPLWEQLQERSGQVGRPIRFQVDGNADLMDAGVRETVRQILRHLLDDVCSAYGEAINAGEDAHDALNVDLTIRREEDRLRIELGDDAPRLRTQASLVEADTLTLYPGVRRSRALIQHLRGLLSIEPQEAPDARFLLTLPASLENRSYLIVMLEAQPVAVPWVLVEGEVPTRGLMVEADQVGQSFSRHGRNVPLVDLAQFVSVLLPMVDEAEHILVLGSVEKRVGVFCSGVEGRLPCEALDDPPPGWQSIADGGLPWSGQNVPVLDVDQLLRRRFDVGAQEMEAGTGSLSEPVVDSYVPVEEPEAPSQPASTSMPSHLRVVLINQSQFRRRELSRTLDDLGHTVLEFADIESALASDPVDFDLMVTDLRLGQSGKDNFDRLMRDRRVPVILTSAVAREQARLLAEKVGADACWLDPYRPVDFQRLLPGLL
jgi:CheY-like chemotaxis protein